MPGRRLERRGFNRAFSARRQPGSAFKPFVYAAAIQQGLTLSSRIETTPVGEADGAGAWRSFWSITFPLLRPVFAVVTILSTIWDFKVFTQIYGIRQGGPNRETVTLALYAYQQGIGSRQFGVAAAISVLMFLPLVAVLAVYVIVVFAVLDAYYLALERAYRRLYDDASKVAGSLWQSAAVEGKPDADAARGIVDSLAHAVAQNRTALLALTALKNYDNYTFTHMVNVSVLTMSQSRALGIDGWERGGGDQFAMFDAVLRRLRDPDQLLAWIGSHNGWATLGKVPEARRPALRDALAAGFGGPLTLTTRIRVLVAVRPA